jgi:hypothetical protein
MAVLDRFEAATPKALFGCSARCSLTSFLVKTTSAPSAVVPFTSPLTITWPLDARMS